MFVPVVRVFVFHPLRFLWAISLLALPWMTVTRCFGQETPPQTEEQRQAREALNKGVQAFKNAQYEEATRDFLRAKRLDPNLLNAQLYLATTYASQYIPGAPSDENRQRGEAAIAEFRDVLTLQPENLSAIDGIGSLLFQMAGTPYDAEKFQESKSYHQRHIELRPNDPAPYYWIGVIDWTLSFRANAELRASYNQKASGRKQVRDMDPLPTELRQQYAREFGPTIAEGIYSLKHAIKLKSGYDDAIAFWNLLYRRSTETASHQNERSERPRSADALVASVKEFKL